MRKIVILTLPLLLFSLTGCNKNEVTYQKIDDISVYYSTEKVASQIEAAQGLNTFTYKIVQNAKNFKYVTERQFDIDYLYCSDYMKLGDDVSWQKQLHLPNFDDYSKAMRYIVDNASSSSTQGQLVNEVFSEELDAGRKLVYNQISDPSYIARQYFLGDVTGTWYKGSDSTLKLKVVGEDEKSTGSLIFDLETLFIKSVSITVPSEELGTCKVKMNFTYPNSLKHKTPEDIGYKS